jgi:excisionase family DNA binding protein
VADDVTRRRCTTKEIADAFGLRPTTIQLYARQGKIPFGTTPGGHRRFDLDEVGAVLGKKSVPKTAMLPCPKCSSPETSMAYCDGCALRPPESVSLKHADDYCRDGEPEHFHRRCSQCSYRWKTDDVIDPRIMCAYKLRQAAA